MTTLRSVIDVSSWSVREQEGAGGDEKLWLADQSDRLWLFKPRTEHATWAQGEDWAEVAVSDVARRLGVPAAHVDLAVRLGRRGSVSRNLRPAGWELQHGALLLTELLPGFVTRSKERSGHTLDNVQTVLRDVAPPADVADLSSFDVFTGFLMLDALVANQDRHEENWAVLRPLPGAGVVTLADSYDHGSSLGFNLTEGRRQLHLERGDVPAYAARARAQRFDQASDGQRTLVELARGALRRCSAVARDRWSDALARVGDDELGGVIDRIPDLSDVTRMFATELLTTNRGRLLRER